MKLLLLNPPNIDEVKVESESIPLGLLYIKEFLQANGMAVSLLNLGCMKSWDEVHSALRGMSFDVVGITCYTPQRLSIYRLAELCRELNPRCRVVLGGPHATFLDTEILKRLDAVDFVVRHEGEYTLLELLNTLQEGAAGRLQDVLGLTFRDGGRIVRNPARGCVENLSVLPPPTFKPEDFENNKKSVGLSFSFERFGRDSRVACLLSSRGCNNACLFCCNGAFWETHRYFSPEYTFRQMSELKNRHGIRFFDISDDDFIFSKDYVHELCDLIIAHGLDVHWWCAGRVNNADQKLLQKMKRAGCFMVSYGFESGSEQILATIKKNRTAHQALESARLTKEAGLLVRCTLTIGHPGEDVQSVADTIEFLRCAQPDQVGLYLLKLYPGTPIYRQFVEEGGIADDFWFDPNEKDLPFYTKESSVEKQLGYRDLILRQISENIVSKSFDNVFHNVHMRLKWS